MKTVDNSFQAKIDNLEAAIDNTSDLGALGDAMAAQPAQLSVDEEKGAFTDSVKAVEEIINRVRKNDKKAAEKQSGHSILSQEQYQGTTPDIQISPPPGKDVGFSSLAASQEIKQKVRPATKDDLHNLDESMIMSMPSISAGSYLISDIMNLKPKNPEIHFRWVNFKNAIAANYSKLRALGFEVASVEDVDLSKSPIDDSMIDGTKVQYYDVQLMKIHVLKLMAVYKSNIVKSLSKLRNYQEAGQAEANRQFNADVANDPALRAGLAKMRIAGNGAEPIEFYEPAK